MSKLIIGCGYLGRRVASRWLAQGHSVHALTRSKVEELQLLGIDAHRGDVREPLDLLRLPPADTVLYAVAPGRNESQSPRDVWQLGLAHTTLAMSEWPKRPRFIFISSTSVYGQTQGEEVEEQSAAAPLEDSGQALVAAERLLLEDWWPDAIILRFAAIYGPGRLLRSQAIRAGEPILADPEKWLNLIHVEDGASAIQAAEERGQAGASYNISDGHPVRRREFYAQLAKELSAPPPRFVLPTPGKPLPPHETANRRISNRRMREELKVLLLYPEYRSGLRASVT
jgi:nucleoside-diphosphate-sugar epimerase